MPTETIILPIGSVTLPDASSGNAAPGVVRAKSSAAAPAPFWLQALFDDSTDEMMMWTFRMPQNYSSAPTLKIQYKMASATWRPPPSRPDGVNPTNNSLQLAKGILLCVAGIRNH